MGEGVSKFERYHSQVSQSSVSSLGQDGSDLDIVSALPFEIQTIVFKFLNPRELARVGRLVCKTWKSTIDDPSFWIQLMSQSGNFTPTKLSDLRQANPVNWAQLYIHTVSEPNLIKSLDSDKVSLKPWSISYLQWERFCDERQVPPLPVVDHRHHYGGGDGWSVEACIKTDNPKDASVLKDNGGLCENYVTSYGWCCRQQVIELSSVGLSDKIMDEVQPNINISEWFAARWDCGSIFNIRVELLTEGATNVVDEFDFSETTQQWLGGELGWRKVEHVFCDYGPGVRYVRFADAGKDIQFWAGLYGSKMAAACVTVTFT